MTIFYYDDDIEACTLSTQSIFLAGPTLRMNVRTPWRLVAIDMILDRLPACDIVVPEFADGDFADHYYKRFGATCPPVRWEAYGLARVTVPLFWMPFGDGYPGLTTRSEVAAFLARANNREAERLTLGMPPNTPASSYIRYHAAFRGIPIHTSLLETVRAAVAHLRSEPSP